jgi:hypothetical protein
MQLPDLVRMLLPARRTTPDEVRQAMAALNISPEQVEWQVAEDGSLACGVKDPPSSAANNYEQAEQAGKLLRWARERRIKVSIIAWVRMPE